MFKSLSIFFGLVIPCFGKLFDFLLEVEVLFNGSAKFGFDFVLLYRYIGHRIILRRNRRFNQVENTGRTGLDGCRILRRDIFARCLLSRYQSLVLLTGLGRELQQRRFSATSWRSLS